MRTEIVPAALGGERVDRMVAMVTGCTRAAAVELIADGGVKTNGRAVRKASTRVQEGDVVAIDESRFRLEAPLEADPAIALSVVHEDDDVVVIDKQAGLIVHPGAGVTEGTLVHGLLARYPEIAEVGEHGRPGVVHRLDRGTSGLLMVARTQMAYEGLVAQLGARQVKRTYFAVAWGHVESDQGIVDAPIGRSKRQPTKMAVMEDGKPARTQYRVSERYSNPVHTSALHCDLETGRTHQIRVHMAAIGHPIVGDEAYGGARKPLPFGRPALHAAELAFTHPVSGEQLEFSASIPPDLEELVLRLRR